MTQKSNLKRYIPIAIGVFFSFFFGMICPPWGAVTEMGVKILGVLIGWLVLCLTDVGMCGASIIAIGAMYFTNYANAGQIYSLAMGNSTIMLCIVIFTLADAFIDCGAGEFIMRWIMSRKFLNGKPYLLTIVLVAGLGVVGMFTVLIIGAALIKNICSITGMDLKGEWSRTIMTYLSVATGLTWSILPFMPPPLQFTAAFKSALGAVGDTMNTGIYMVTVILEFVFLIVLFFIYVKFFCKFDLSKLAECDGSKLQTAGFEKMTKQQIIITLTLVISCFYPFLILLLPQDSALYATLNGLGQTLFMCIAIGALCIVRVDGKPLMDCRASLNRSISWDVIMATAAVQLVSGALSSDASGITQWLIDVCGGFITGMGIVPLVITVVVLVTVLTQFFSNTATGIIFASIFAPLAMIFYHNGDTTFASILPALIAGPAMCACLIPAGSSQIAFILGTDILEGDVSYMIKSGWKYMIITILAGCTAGLIMCAVV